MTDISQDRLDAAFADALSRATAADLASLVPHMERFGLAHDLDLVIRTARPGAKVQRRFMPAHAQGEILRAALRTAKAQDLVQDVVIGFYAEELGEAVENPTLEQLRAATDVVLGRAARPLVEFTLLGVVARHEAAEAQAGTVLRDVFGLDLSA